jgi:RNA polymerase-binding transcription factor DksA
MPDSPSLQASRDSGATLLLVEERYESELTRSSAVLDGVDRALERLSEGSYGQCEACDAQLLDADLEQDPTRTMCEQHVSLA